VATYLTESSQSFFNFYSGIRRIDYVAAPENLPAYLSRPGAHFVLMKQHPFERLKKNPVAHLQVISVHAPNASGWFATSFPRWVLVYSCTTDCPPPAVYSTQRQLKMNGARRRFLVLPRRLFTPFFGTEKT